MGIILQKILSTDRIGLDLNILILHPGIGHPYLRRLWHPGAVDAGSTYVSSVDRISRIANINRGTSSTLIAPVFIHIKKTSHSSTPFFYLPTVSTTRPSFLTRPFLYLKAQAKAVDCISICLIAQFLMVTFYSPTGYFN